MSLYSLYLSRSCQYDGFGIKVTESLAPRVSHLKVNFKRTIFINRNEHLWTDFILIMNSKSDLISHETSLRASSPFQLAGEAVNHEDQFAVLYFSTSLIVLIQVYNWEIQHHSLVCCCGFADILNILEAVNARATVPSNATRSTRAWHYTIRLCRKLVNILSSRLPIKIERSRELNLTNFFRLPITWVSEKCELKINLKSLIDVISSVSPENDIIKDRSTRWQQMFFYVTIATNTGRTSRSRTFIEIIKHFTCLVKEEARIFLQSQRYTSCCTCGWKSKAWKPADRELKAKLIANQVYRTVSFAHLSDKTNIIIVSKLIDFSKFLLRSNLQKHRRKHL